MIEKLHYQIQGYQTYYAPNHIEYFKFDIFVRWGYITLFAVTLVRGNNQISHVIVSARDSKFYVVYEGIIS